MWGVVSKEARELAASPLSFFVLLLAPCLVLWLAVQLPESVRATLVYVEGADCCVQTSDQTVRLAPCETPSADEVRQALSDVQDITLVDGQRGDEDVWSFLGRNRIDAAFIWAPAATGTGENQLGYQRGGVWMVYADPRRRADAARLDFAVRLVQADDIANAGLRRRPAPAVVDVGADETNTTGADAEGDSPPAAAREVEGMRLPAVGPLALGASIVSDQLQATPFALVTRDGPAPSTSAWLAPGLIALISGFVAFLVGASSLARESELGTIHWLAVATRNSWFSVGAAKVVTATAMGALALLAMIAFAWLGLGLPVNQGLGLVFGVQVLSLLTSGMQGVAVSALIGRQDHAFMVSGGYLVLLTLFSGIFLPVENAGGATDFISWLLPQTFSQASLADWMQRGVFSAPSEQSLTGLLLLLSGSAVTLAVALQRLAVRQ